MELKPCPFCGGPARLEELGDHHGEYHNLGCSDTQCYANRIIFHERDATVAESVKWWNTRKAT